MLLLALPAARVDAMMRMAIIIGNNQGLGSETPLQYAARDAQQIDAVLEQLGGVDKGCSYVLLNSSLTDVYSTFATVREKIRGLRAQGEKVQLLIYFSGHGSEESLHLNGRLLPFSDIKMFFKDAEADLKLLIADACFSGALLQAKGATLANPVPVRYANELDVNGSAILTSSSAGEFSQESKDLQGSLFTHYFVAALRGAADFDHDGRVTLWEAYSQTKVRMLHRFASSPDAMQTPSFNMDIKGSDQVVLTRLDQGQASLILRGLPKGEYRVLDAANGLQVAEVFLDDPHGSSELALPKAAYKVYQVAGDVGLEGFADLRHDKRIELSLNDFRQSELGSLASKGANPPALAGDAAPTPGASGANAYAFGERMRIAVDSRYYSSFPGRDGSSLGWNAALHWHRGQWDMALAYGMLSKYHSRSGLNDFDQGAQSLALEGRYYWLRSKWISSFAGPRFEGWSVSQSLNGVEMDNGRMLAGFALLGIDKDLTRHLSLELGAYGGAFLRNDGKGTLSIQPSLPLSLSLRFGL
jgi:NAD(P)-dependent dehydrogenase (short-subunit alcohol dehydrogenase family)